MADGIVMVCPVCRGTEQYYGRYVFSSELEDDKPPPLCPNHPPEEPVALVAVD